MKKIAILMLIPLAFMNHRSAETEQKNPIMLHRVTGDGQPLVLVPGGLTGWVSWDSFVPEFSGKKVIQVQLLNVQYGLEGTALPQNYSVRTESEALAAALSSAGLNEKADFVGWSYGGMVLLDFALNHPEKVRTLTLVEPPAVWVIKKYFATDPEMKKVADYLSGVPGTHAPISEKDLENFLVFAGFAKAGESVRSLPQWNGWVHFKNSLRNNSAVLKHNDLRERLRNFTAPVLLVKGTGSAYFLHRIIDECAGQFPNAKSIELPGGHAPHLVSRDSFLKALAAFQQ